MSDQIEQIKNEVDNKQQVSSEKLPDEKISKEEISALDTEIKKSVASDYAANMQTVDTKITEVTTNLNKLKQDVAEYDKQKATLTDELKKEKEDLLAKQKAAIEEKKAEIEKMLIDMKLAQLDQTQMQEVAAADEKMKKISADLSTVKTEGFWTKSWNRVKEHKKPILIATGVGIGIWALTRLFRRSNNSGNSNENNGEGNSEKKGFFNRGIGKVLKYAGIGILGFLGLRWLINKLTPQANARDEVTTSETPIQEAVKIRLDVPTELKTKYNTTGDTIQSMLNTLYGGELHGVDTPAELTVSKDQQGKEVKLPSGIFLAVLDNVHDNVGEALSTKSIYNEGLTSYADRLIEYVTDKITSGAKEVGKLFSPFVGLFGLGKEMFNADGSTNEYFKTWLLDKSMDRQTQIEFVLRQYMRVRTFLFEKRKLLIRSLTAKKLGISDINDPKVDEKMEDSSFQASIQSEVKTLYEDRKIETLDNVSAMQTLRDHNILNDKYDPTTQGILDDINERKEREIGSSLDDAVVSLRGLNDDDPIDIKTSDDLLTVGENFSEAVNDEQWEETWYETILAWAPLDVWTNSTKHDIRKCMEAIGYDKLKYGYLKKSNELMQKFRNRTATKKDVLEFKELVESFYRLQKEVALGGEMENVIDSERGTGEKILLTIRGFGIIEIVAGVGLLITCKYFPGAGRIIGGAIKWTVGTPLTLSWMGTKFTMRKMSWMDKTMGTSWLRRGAFTSEKRFKEYFRKGRISPDQAETMITAKYDKKLRKTAHINDLIKQEFMGGEFGRYKIDGTLRDMNADDFRRFFDHGNLRKLIADAKAKKVDMHAVMQGLFDYEHKVKSLTGNKKEFMELLLKKANFKSINDVEKITKYIDDLDIVNMDAKDVEKLVSSFGRKISKFNTLAEIKKSIQTELDVIKGLSQNTEAMGDVGKIISHLSLSRAGSGTGIPKEFETGGKFDKPEYASIKKKYQDALTIADEPQRKIALDAVDKEFTDKLLKNGNKLEDILGFSSDRKAVLNSIDEGLNSVHARKLKYESYSFGKKQSVLKFYDNQVNKLTTFRNNIHLMPEDEIKIFKSLDQFNMKPTHAIELFELRGVKGIKDAVNSGDAAKLLSELEGQKSVLGISDELLESIRFINKSKIGQFGAEIRNVLKNAIKLIARLK